MKESGSPGMTVMIVGRAVEDAVGELLEEAPKELAGVLETELDELEPGTIFSWRVMLDPSLKVTVTATAPVPMGWVSGTAISNSLPFNVIQSWKGTGVIAVGSTLDPSWRAYGRRFNDRVWPCATVRTVGREVEDAVEDAVEGVVEEALDVTTDLLDEVEPCTTLSWKGIIEPSLKVTETVIGVALMG